MASFSPDLDGLYGDILLGRILHAGCQGRAALVRARRREVLAPRLYSSLACHDQGLELLQRTSPYVTVSPDLEDAIWGCHL
jgi:hypothetical protein